MCRCCGYGRGNQGGGFAEPDAIGGIDTVEAAGRGFGIALLDRPSRTIGVTAEGEQLLGYGRRMIAMNDEIFSQMMNQAYEGAGSGGPT